jgi:hypothetical protein
MAEVGRRAGVSRVSAADWFRGRTISANIKRFALEMEPELRAKEEAAARAAEQQPVSHA